MKLTASVFVPVVVTLLLSFVLLPIVRAMNKAHIPWVLSTVLVILLFVIFIVIIGTLTGTSLRTIAVQYPKYEDKFLSIYKIFADKFNLQFDSGKSFFDNLWTQLSVRDFTKRIAFSLSNDAYSLGKSIVLVCLMLFFLLAEMRLGRAKIDAAFKGGLQGRVVRITKNVMVQVMRFISIKFFISLATGILVFLGTFAIRMDFAIVWGFLAFIMNFIPNFGSIFSSLLTTLFAVVQFYPDSPGYIIYVFLLMLTVNMVLGNIVEPRIEGTNLGISPFIILVMLTFWGWMWGFVGMILAVPITVILKIVCENISFLHPVAIFLGNRPQDEEHEFSASDSEDNPKTKSDK